MNGDIGLSDRQACNGVGYGSCAGGFNFRNDGEACRVATSEEEFDSCEAADSDAEGCVWVL